MDSLGERLLGFYVIASTLVGAVVIAAFVLKVALEAVLGLWRLVRLIGGES